MDNNKPTINGIDVSECEYFNSVTYEEPYCNIDQEHLYACSSDENCYFKQLKRLQEENEELKAEITKFRWDNPYYDLYNNVVGQRDNLERENEELKEKIKDLELITGIFSVRLMEKYKQALEEIREIAKHWLNNDWSCYHCRNNMDEKLKEIIKLTRF